MYHKCSFNGFCYTLFVKSIRMEGFVNKGSLQLSPDTFHSKPKLKEPGFSLKALFHVESCFFESHSMRTNPPIITLVIGKFKRLD